MQHAKYYLLIPWIFSGCLEAMPLAGTPRINPQIQAERKRLKDELDAQFIRAVQRGSHYDIGFYLRKGANINARDKDGNTALHIVRTHRDIGLLKLLLGAKADVNLYDQEGLTVLQAAAEIGDLPSMKALIEAKADVNVREEKGRTALHYASGRNQIESIKALIEAHADINARDKDGNTALQWALKWDNDASVKALIKYSYWLVPSEQAVSESRKRISNALVQFVRLRNQHPELENLKCTTLQFEILSKNELLQKDLVIILLDELKKGRKIKTVTLIRSKEAAIEYLLEKVKEIISGINEPRLKPSSQTLVDPAKVKENFAALIKEGLDERIEQLKSTNS